jgi:hypothetical protein
MELLILGIVILLLSTRKAHGSVTVVHDDPRVRELEQRLSRIESFLNQLYFQLKPRGTKS